MEELRLNAGYIVIEDAHVCKYFSAPGAVFHARTS